MSRKVARMKNSLRGWCTHECDECEGDTWLCHAENGDVRDHTFGGFYIENGETWIFNGESSFWESDQSDDEAQLLPGQPNRTIPPHRLQTITVDP